jgi:hypothetical protein
MYVKLKNSWGVSNFQLPRSPMIIVVYGRKCWKSTPTKTVDDGKMIKLRSWSFSWESIKSEAKNYRRDVDNLMDGLIIQTGHHDLNRRQILPLCVWRRLCSPNGRKNCRKISRIEIPRSSISKVYSANKWCRIFRTLQRDSYISKNIPVTSNR